MLKKIAKTVKAAGELRREVAGIDYKKIYGREEGIKKQFEMLQKLEVVTEIQYELLSMVKEVRE